MTLLNAPENMTPTSWADSLAGIPGTLQRMVEQDDTGDHTIVS
jgi:hypothetical protein